MRTRFAVWFGAILLLTCASTGWTAVGADVYGTIDGNPYSARLTQSEDEFGPVPEASHVLSVASWNGKTLGSEWALACGVQSAPAEVKGGLDGKGTGVVITTTTFEGGSFYMTQLGPWGDTWGNLTGVILVNEVVLTEYYKGWMPAGTEMVADARGVTKTGREVRFQITDCLGWGKIEGMVRNFPKLLDQSCQPTRTHGYWGEMGEVTITIVQGGARALNARSEDGDQVTPALAPTWGAVKIRYR